MTYNDFVKNPPSFIKVYDASRDGFVICNLTSDGNRYSIDAIPSKRNKKQKTFLSFEQVYRNAVTYSENKPLYVNEIKTNAGELVR